MKQRDNLEEELMKDDGNKNNKNEQEADYSNSSEVSNPNPSTATPSIPTEMPVR